MDLTDTIAPRSDQLNAEDLLTGPRTVTITKVSAGSAEQPVNVYTAEFGDGRPFKPSKTVRRLMVAAWGKDSAAYAGRRMTLYRDPAVKFGGMDVGGIRVSHMSHIEKRIVLALTVTRGRRAPYTVDPLPDEPQPTPTSPAPQDATEERADGITDRQRGMIFALFGKAGITSDVNTDEGKKQRLSYIHNAIGRTVASTNDLSKREAGVVIEMLQNDAGDPS